MKVQRVQAGNSQERKTHFTILLTAQASVCLALGPLFIAHFDNFKNGYICDNDNAAVAGELL